MAGIECGKVDVSKIPEEEIIAAGNLAWIKADVDEKIYIWNNKPNVVIKFSDVCVQTVCTEHDNLIRSLLFTSTGLKTQDNDSGTNVDENNSREFQPKTVCGADAEWLSKVQNAVDAHGLNNMGYQPAAIMPSAAIIPMKSNIKMYGPYASSNFGNSAGGTQVTVDADICPWIFGSIAAMNAAGTSIVESSAIGLIRAESGSVTIPGLPDIGALGDIVGASGPNLTNLNFTFGSSGVSTSYEFKTYTPKFGTLNRHYINKFKDIAQNRQEQLKFLRTSQIVQNKIGRKIQNAKRKIVLENKLPGNNREASLQRILVGEIYNWDSSGINPSQRTVVGTNTLSKGVNEMVYDYDKKAYMSWDGFIGPVSLYGDGGLPRYALFDGSGHKSSPISPQPPFSVSGDCNNDQWIHEQYNLEITREYSNPLTNNFAVDQHHHIGSGAGHVIDILGRKSTVPESGIITNMYRPGENDKYANDYRFLGMRGPIVLHSWGYDLEGKPVPNASDTEESTKQGSFKNTSLKDAFLQDWLKKPATWPVAPIDLRFDRTRGLWVSPQAYKIVVAKITDTVHCYSEGKGIIIPYGKPLFDQEGLEIKPKTGKEEACGPSIEDKEYEWILTNIEPCPITTTVLTGVICNNNILEFTTAVIKILDVVSTDTISIDLLNCTSSPSSSCSMPPTPPPASLTPTPTVTPTPTLTPTPSPTPSSSSSGGTAYDATVMIHVVDRLGKTHKIGELVYAYFDTSTEKYIVLQRHDDPITPTVYGTYTPLDDSQGSLVVEYATGIEYCDDGIMQGSEITVMNKLNLITNCVGPAIAIKMEKLRPGEI